MTGYHETVSAPAAETGRATIRAFVADLSRANGWRLPVLVGLMGAVAVTEGMTITLLLPLLTRIGIAGSQNSAAAVAIDNVLETIAPGGGVGAILLIIGCLALVQMTLFVALSWWGAKIVHQYAFQWQTRLFESFLRANWLFLTQRKAGELTSAIVVEGHRIGGAFYYFNLLASTAVACAVYLLFGMLISWRATLLLIALAFVMVLSIARLYRISHAAGQDLGPLNARLQVLVTESLASAKIIKATVSEKLMEERIGGIAHALERAGRIRLFLPNVVRAVFEFMAFVALASFLAFGVTRVGVAPADIVVILALFVRIFPRFTQAQTLLHDLNMFAPAIHILQRLHTEAAASAERVGGSGDMLRVALPTRLEIRGLHAAYGDNTVLKGVDVTLDVPGMIGIVGGSGAGKSTLVHVLLALIEPSAGTIRLGPHDMSGVAPEAWRRLIGYVPQETMLFHASVAENLALARPDATHEEIVEVARRANAHDFIMALPQGYDTPIGDQGALLSGGQRQRLGIARALLARPVLLLLDEPTSALDPQSEAEILITLEELRKSVGILIVAHRLTTVQAADRIYVLESGTVAEEGNWSELIVRQSRFHSLAKLQQIIA